MSLNWGQSIQCEMSLKGAKLGSWRHDRDLTYPIPANLAQCLWFDLTDQDIGVSVICPGYVETPLTEQNDYRMPALISGFRPRWSDAQPVRS